MATDNVNNNYLAPDKRNVNANVRFGVMKKLKQATR